MKTLRPILLAFVSIVCAQASLSEEVLKLVSQAAVEQEQGQYDLAAKKLEAAAELAGDDNLVLIDVLCRLGIAYQDLGRFFEAEQKYRRAERIARREGVPAQYLLGSALNNLGALYVETGRFAVARQRLEEALGIQESIGGSDADVFPILSHLAEASIGTGDPSRGAELYERALRVARNAYGPKSWEVASALHNLASVRFREGLLDEAGLYLEDAIDVLRHTLGAWHPRTGMAFSNLAALRLEQGRLEDAEAASLSALEILRQTHQEDHPNIGYALQTYSEVLAKSGRGKQAKHLRRQAKEIERQSREDNLLDHVIDVSAFRSRN